MWKRSFDLIVNSTEHNFEKRGSLYSTESDLINLNWTGCSRRRLR
jgi:hypothetical protein